MVQNPEALSGQIITEAQTTPELAKALARTSAREKKTVVPSKTERKLYPGLRPIYTIILLAVLASLPGVRASAHEMDIDKEVNNALRGNDTGALVSGGWNINHKDALDAATRFLALNSDLIEASQDDDEPMTGGDDEPRIEGDDTPEIIDAFDGDLAAFAFDTGEFPEIDEILETILETVDAELLENKQISFDKITVTDGQLFNEDGSPFEIPNEAAQNTLSQLVENLPDGSTISINFIIDNLTQDDEGNLSVVLGFTVTYTSEVPTADGENLKRTDITYLDGDNLIQTVEGTPVPDGVTTGSTLTTAGEIRSALAEKGITLDAEDFETVLVETMTRANGGTPQEIIIRMIYGDITGEPSVITPTSAEITVPGGVNIRTERNTSSATRTNVSPFQAATFADFAPGTDISNFVLNNDGQITINEGGYDWIILRNPSWTPGPQNTTEPRLLFAAFADTATINPATGTPMPNVSVENTGPVASPTLQPEAEPAPEPDLTGDPDVDETPPPPGGGGEVVVEVPPVVVTPEAMFGFEAGATWENLTFATPDGPVTVSVNPESFVEFGSAGIIPLGFYSKDELISLGIDEWYSGQINQYFETTTHSIINPDTAFIVSGIPIRISPTSAIIATRGPNNQPFAFRVEALSSVRVASVNSTTGAQDIFWGANSSARDTTYGNGRITDPIRQSHAVVNGNHAVFVVSMVNGGIEAWAQGNFETFGETANFVNRIQSPRPGDSAFIHAAIVNASTNRN